MKISRFILVMSIFIVMSGCASQQGLQPSLEKLGIISVAGFDYIDNDNMRLTVIMPQPALEAEKHTQVISVEEDMLHKGLLEISSLSDKTVSLKQLRVALFSEEFARKGQMKEMVEYLFKDSDVRSTVFVAIVKDSAEEMLRMEYPDKQNTSSYINNLFHPKQYAFFSPFTTIHDFVYDETDPLRDTIVPYVELKDEVIHIAGLAMFNDGKMETIFTKQDGKIIQILRHREKLSVFALTLDDEGKEKVALEFVESKAKVKTENLESPKVSIKVKFEGTLSEYEGEKDLTNRKDVETLEKEVSKNIEQDIRKLLEKCQEHSIEPLGLFETLRMRYKGDWPMSLTKELLAKAEFNIKVETKLTSVGALK